MKRYEIIVKCNICGNEVECLHKVVLGEENAINEVNALTTKGKVARYEEKVVGTAWYDEENWIG